MKLSLSQKELTHYLANQLNFFFLDGKKVSESVLEGAVSEALRKICFCFTNINLKSFFDGTEVVFNHLHSDQYSMFLYFASRCASLLKLENQIPTKIYLLNKVLHGIDVFYERELPSIFLFVHPLGTVLGRAEYSNYFLVHQGCTVGHNHEKHPILGEGLTLYSGSLVAGNCVIGKNCKIGAHSSIIDKTLSDNTLYLGNPSSFSERPNPNLMKVWRTP